MTRDVSSRSGSGPFDDCLRALEHERRREVLTALIDAESPLSVTALADGEERGRLALNHHHLPVLADGGYVDWDRDTGRVRRGPRFDEIGTLLDLLRTHEDDFPWTVV